MTGLPDGWESDYDGKRWFYRYKPSGITQFTFPKPGDEFPEYVDNFFPPPPITPEEERESAQRVKKRSTFNVAKSTGTSTTRQMRNSASSGISGYETGPGGESWFQQDGLMYMGPGGGYTDISPLQEEDEYGGGEAVAGGHGKDGSLVARSLSQRTVEPASTDPSPLPTPGQIFAERCDISPGTSPQGTPAAPENQPASAGRTPIVVNHITREAVTVDTRLTMAPSTGCSGYVVGNPTGQLVDPYQHGGGPGIQMLDSRPIHTISPDPVGQLAELYSDQRIQCQDELAPVELPTEQLMSGPSSYGNATLVIAPAELPVECHPRSYGKEQQQQQQRQQQAESQAVPSGRGASGDGSYLPFVPGENVTTQGNPAKPAKGVLGRQTITQHQDTELALTPTSHLADVPVALQPHHALGISLEKVPAHPESLRPGPQSASSPHSNPSLLVLQASGPSEAPGMVDDEGISVALNPGPARTFAPYRPPGQEFQTTLSSRPHTMSIGLDGIRPQHHTNAPKPSTLQRYNTLPMDMPSLPFMPGSTSSLPNQVRSVSVAVAEESVVHIEKDEVVTSTGFRPNSPHAPAPLSLGPKDARDHERKPSPNQPGGRIQTPPTEPGRKLAATIVSAQATPTHDASPAGNSVLPVSVPAHTAEEAVPSRPQQSGKMPFSSRSSAAGLSTGVQAAPVVPPGQALQTEDTDRDRGSPQVEPIQQPLVPPTLEHHDSTASQVSQISSLPGEAPVDAPSPITEAGSPAPATQPRPFVSQVAQGSPQGHLTPPPARGGQAQSPKRISSIPSACRPPSPPVQHPPANPRLPSTSVDSVGDEASTAAAHRARRPSLSSLSHPSCLLNRPTPPPVGQEPPQNPHGSAMQQPPSVASQAQEPVQRPGTIGDRPADQLRQHYQPQDFQSQTYRPLAYPQFQQTGQQHQDSQATQQSEQLADGVAPRQHHSAQGPPSPASLLSQGSGQSVWSMASNHQQTFVHRPPSTAPIMQGRPHLGQTTFSSSQGSPMSPLHPQPISGPGPRLQQLAQFQQPFHQAPPSSGLASGALQQPPHQPRPAQTVLNLTGSSRPLPPAQVQQRPPLGQLPPGSILVDPNKPLPAGYVLAGGPPTSRPTPAPGPQPVPARPPPGAIVVDPSKPLPPGYVLVSGQPQQPGPQQPSAPLPGSSTMMQSGQSPGQARPPRVASQPPDHGQVPERPGTVRPSGTQTDYHVQSHQMMHYGHHDQPNLHMWPENQQQHDPRHRIPLQQHAQNMPAGAQQMPVQSQNDPQMKHDNHIGQQVKPGLHEPALLRVDSGRVSGQAMFPQPLSHPPGTSGLSLPPPAAPSQSVTQQQLGQKLSQHLQNHHPGLPGLHHHPHQNQPGLQHHPANPHVSHQQHGNHQLEMLVKPGSTTPQSFPLSANALAPIQGQSAKPQHQVQAQSHDQPVVQQQAVPTSQPQSPGNQVQPHPPQSLPQSQPHMVSLTGPSQQRPPVAVGATQTTVNVQPFTHVVQQSQQQMSISGSLALQANAPSTSQQQQQTVQTIAPTTPNSTGSGKTEWFGKASSWFKAELKSDKVKKAGAMIVGGLVADQLGGNAVAGANIGGQIFGNSRPNGQGQSQGQGRPAGPQQPPQHQGPRPSAQQAQSQGQPRPQIQQQQQQQEQIQGSALQQLQVPGQGKPAARPQQHPPTMNAQTVSVHLQVQGQVQGQGQGQSQVHGKVQTGLGHQGRPQLQQQQQQRPPQMTQQPQQRPTEPARPQIQQRPQSQSQAVQRPPVQMVQRPPSGAQQPPPDKIDMSLQIVNALVNQTQTQPSSARPLYQAPPWHPVLNRCSSRAGGLLTTLTLALAVEKKHTLPIATPALMGHTTARKALLTCRRATTTKLRHMTPRKPGCLHSLV
ncbi:hypothetical protein DL546_004742 [Coniochaeta pulveracea]|uniref:WW domain-containing protein n=1 Tax=Coniochaeta pulveracea TaxID=177199 RepID=A0A420Y087_9PEZI|nr:hypothetical protein DL546_004742 [Coniochaeta pulveracea]